MNRIYLFKHLSLLLLLQAIIWPGYSQDYTNTANPSADASASLRNAQSPVNHYTGTVNVQVPLYNIQSRGIQVPIGVSYATTGIRIKDRPTEVGLGWRLSAGGKITRVMRGMPDETQNANHKCGYLNRTFPSDASILDLVYHNGSLKYSPYKNYYEIDGEPDLFYFEIPGLSGMFVFDQQGNALTIPYQNISITWVNREYFEIKDANGFTYTLGNSAQSRETTVATFESENYRSGSMTHTFTSSWHLDKITTYAGNTVQFSYVSSADVTTTDHNESYSFELDERSNKYNWKDKIYNNQTKTQAPKHISQMTWDGGRVAFSYTSLNTSMPKLNNIALYYNNELTQTTTLSYSTFANGNAKLDRIDRSAGSLSEMVAKFEYDTSQNLPSTSSLSYDHWGFYNGKTNTQYRAACDIIEITPTLIRRPNISGADRSVSLACTQANILKAVCHPGGGKTEYIYELNTAYGGSNKVVGGLRIKEIIQTSEGNTLNTKYTYLSDPNNPNSQSSGVTTNIDPVYYYYSFVNVNQRNLFFGVMNCLSNITDVNGTRVTYWRVAEELPDGSQTVYDFTAANETQYQDLPIAYWHDAGSLAIMVPRGILPTTSHVWKRGLPKAVKKHTAGPNRTLISETRYTYDLNAPIKDSAIVLMPWNGYVLDYKWFSQPVFLKSVEEIKGPYNPYSKTSYEYDQTYLVPRKIIQTDAQGDVYATETRYSFDEYAPFVRTQMPPHYESIAIFNRDGVIAPIEKITTKNGALTGVEFFEYKPINPIITLTPALAKRQVVRLTNPVALPPSGFPWSSLISHDPNYLYETETIFDQYDSYGNLVSSYRPNGNRNYVVYGYNNSLPIAEAENANFLYHTSFEDVPGAVTTNNAKTGQKIFSGTYTINIPSIPTGNYTLTYWKKAGSGSSWEKVKEHVIVPGPSFSRQIGENAYYIDEVRLIPVAARIKTYTYKPGIGKTSEMDHNGVVRYWEYDAFGRVTKVLDNERHVLEEYEYKTKNQ